jgi:hypothetical protein
MERWAGPVCAAGGLSRRRTDPGGRVLARVRARMRTALRARTGGRGPAGRAAAVAEAAALLVAASGAVASADTAPAPDAVSAQLQADHPTAAYGGLFGLWATMDRVSGTPDLGYVVTMSHGLTYYGIESYPDDACPRPAERR